MSIADMIFDVSSLRYPKYRGGLIQLAEDVTISSFIFSLEAMNDNITLTHDQLQECWFHALHQEYEKVLSSSDCMTQGQIDDAVKLLSLGIKKVETLPWHSKAEWNAADYESSQNMNEGNSQQNANTQKARRRQRLQDFDPLLLLQSTPEIRLHAETLYKGGLQKVLKKARVENRLPKMQQYKQTCVNQAQEYVKRQLRAKYSAEKEAGPNQSARDTEKALEPQSAPQNWKKEAKWQSVWIMLREERKKIVSDLGGGSLTGQDVNMGIDASDTKSNADGTVPRRTTIPQSVLIGMSKHQRRRAVRAWKDEELHQATKGVETSKVLTRSMVLSQQQIQQADQDSIMEIERGLKNLLCDEEIPESSQQGQESQPHEKEAARSTTNQFLADMKVGRRERKAAARRRDEIIMKVQADLGRSAHSASISLEREPSSNLPTGDFERVLTHRQLRSREKRLRFFGRKPKNYVNPAGAGTSARTYPELRAEVEKESVPTPCNPTTQVEKPETGTATAEGQTETGLYEGSEMDIEMSGRIAQLEM